MKYAILWIMFGLVSYLGLWGYRLRSPETMTHYKFVYQKHGLKPFLKGLMMVILGPLVIILMMYINKKKL